MKRKSKHKQLIDQVLSAISARTTSWLNLSYTGIIVGIFFGALSLTPSLLPRTWLFQGIVSGISLAVGYGIGNLISATWRFMQLPLFTKENVRPLQHIVVGLDILWLLHILTQTGKWQNTLRGIIGVTTSASTNIAITLLFAITVGLILLSIARLIRYTTRRVSQFATRYVPPRVAFVFGVLFSIWLFGSVMSGAFRSQALRLANNTFSVADQGIKEGSYEPLSPLRSAGPGSFVSWDDLGRQGKEFVGRGPTQNDIASFHAEAQEPIRVYASLNNGETHQERAQVVLQELLRTNAFDRSKLVIATSTGTGFIDPNAVDTFEYLHAGDTAFATQQYSYLPSWISLLTEGQTAKDAGIALFNEVHGYWQQLDPETRPELYLYGLSLGAYGSQASISRVELLNDPVDGALWVGSPFVSEFWNRITADRDPGSPAWLPRYQEGRVVRFTGEENNLYDLPGPWQENKIIYVQYPSDPVVFFSTDHIFFEPDWLEQPRGPGVTEDFNWYPFVTFWQLAFDFMSAGSTPPGYGHIYSTDIYIDSWQALTAPTLDQEIIDQIKQHFNQY